MSLIVLVGLSAILAIVSFVILIIVLVKQFKHAGLLHGFLGIITFGLYTFIWGWMKHRPLQMTRLMLTWSILCVASMVVQGVAFTTGAVQMLSMINGFKKEITVAAVNQRQPSGSGGQPFSLKQIRQRSTHKGTIPAAAEAATSDSNLDQRALALWQGERYSDPDLAVEYWTGVISSHPEMAEAFNNRGLAFYDLRRYRQAVQDYTRAIELNAGHEKAYNNRGNAYYEIAEYQLALSDLNRSLQLKPDYSKAHLNRGLVYYQLDKNDMACVDFQAACSMGECDGKNWAEKNGICQ